jgi:hypothetical protein
LFSVVFPSHLLLVDSPQCTAALSPAIWETI